MNDFFMEEPVEDSATDFLRREQAALGSDAASFGAVASGTDHDFERSAAAFPDLDGGDDILAPAAHTPSLSNPLTAGALGGGGTVLNEHVSVTGTNEFSAFESQFPEVEVSPVAAYSNNGIAAPAPSYKQSPSLFAGTPQPQEQESDAIKAWRVKQAAEIADREAASTRKKDETIAQARHDIDTFYTEYNAKKAKNIARNKEQETVLESARKDALAKGTTWDRVCTLVDLQDSRSKSSTKSAQDLTRFRDILIKLRKDPKAPRAGGY